VSELQLHGNTAAREERLVGEGNCRGRDEGQQGMKASIKLEGSTRAGGIHRVRRWDLGVLKPLKRQSAPLPDRCVLDE
jgi:hypothetical protein